MQISLRLSHSFEGEDFFTRIQDTAAEFLNNTDPVDLRDIELIVTGASQDRTKLTWRWRFRSTDREIEVGFVPVPETTLVKSLATALIKKNPA